MISRSVWLRNVEFWIEGERWSWAQKRGKAKCLVNGLEKPLLDVQVVIIHISIKQRHYFVELELSSLLDPYSTTWLNTYLDSWVTSLGTRNVLHLYLALGCHAVLITMPQFQLRVRSGGDLASCSPPTTDSRISKSTQDFTPDDRDLILFFIVVGGCQA